jgi:glycosyltransferase involved in cell wall biosynthesis
MAAGLPVLVSNKCGCFEELVAEGANGFGFDPGDSQQLTRLMARTGSLTTEELKRMGGESLRRIKLFSTEIYADGLKNALECAMSSKERRPA